MTHSKAQRNVKHARVRLTFVTLVDIGQGSLKKIVTPAHIVLCEANTCFGKTRVEARCCSLISAFKGLVGF